MHAPVLCTRMLHGALADSARTRRRMATQALLTYVHANGTFIRLARVRPGHMLKGVLAACAWLA